MPEHFFPQQVALLLQRLTAARPPWGAAPAGAPEQVDPSQDALARALTAVSQLPEPLTAQERGDAQWLRYERACSALLASQHLWTNAERPLVRDLLALRGTVLVARGEWAAAEPYLRRALALAPIGDVARTLARVEEQHGDQAQSAGAWLQALSRYRQAFEYDPGNPAYAQKLARLHAFYAAERRHQRRAAGKRVARRVALGGILLVGLGGGLWRLYHPTEGPQSPALISRPAQAPEAGPPVESAVAPPPAADTGAGGEQEHGLERAEAPAERVPGRASRQEEEARLAAPAPSLAAPLPPTAAGPGTPPAPAPRLLDVPPAVRAQVPDHSEPPANTGAGVSPQLPRIMAASPPATAVELAGGAVQTFAVHARGAVKAERLTYTWRLNGRPVARGPAWVFQAPAQSVAEPGYHVTVEVADRRGQKARVSWELSVKQPSPLPRIVAAQPPTRKVAMAVGQALEFSVTAEVGDGSGEAPQGLSYHWQVDGTAMQTTQTPGFAFVATTPTTYHLAVVVVSPAGFKSTPKGWLIEVRPAAQAPAPS